MACAGCGAEIPADARLCDRCSGSLAAPAEAQIPAAMSATHAGPVAPTPWAQPTAPPTAWPAPQPVGLYVPPFEPHLLPRRQRPNRQRVGIAIAAAVVVVVVGSVSAVLALSRGPAGRAPSTLTTLPSTPFVPGVPSGYTAFVDRADRFSIGVPRAWRQIDLASPGASQRLDQIVHADPGMARVLGNGSAISNKVRFLALDPNFTGFSPNVNVAVEPAVGIRDADLPQVLVGVQATYARAGLTVERVAYVPLAGHQALELTVTHPPIAQISPAETSRQYFVAANDLMYVVTVSGASPDLAAVADSFNVGS
jgi:hypothetical protein